MARILLGVSGGIAAYKALELARLATKAGHARARADDARRRGASSARPRSRASSARRCSPTSSSATRCAAPSPATIRPTHDPIGHLEVVGNADAFLVAPASANTIAKLAAGLCDSMLTTSFLACTAPRLVAPAMNDRMYADAATQANLADSARARGHA